MEVFQRINELLRDRGFAIKLTKSTADKNPGTSSTIIKKVADEKIATNLAGFYAVECGIGAIHSITNQNPVSILKAIVNKEITATQKLLLQRFANATWKAGQPFKGLQRIEKTNFVIAANLNEEDIKKDDVQVMAAAELLLSRLAVYEFETSLSQLKQIEALLKDRDFSVSMAKHLDEAYYRSAGKEAPPFLNTAEEIATIERLASEEEVAIKIAGFYALESGLGYLVAAEHLNPLEALKSIVDDCLSEPQKQLFERFANATWKAGQPFRSLERISREVFKPFDLLSGEETAKDWEQIQKAAALILEDF